MIVARRDAHINAKGGWWPSARAPQPLVNWGGVRELVSKDHLIAQTAPSLGSAGSRKATEAVPISSGEQAAAP